MSQSCEAGLPLLDLRSAPFAIGSATESTRDRMVPSIDSARLLTTVAEDHSHDRSAILEPMGSLALWSCAYDPSTFSPSCALNTMRRRACGEASLALSRYCNFCERGERLAGRDPRYRDSFNTGAFRWLQCRQGRRSRRREGRDGGAHLAGASDDVVPADAAAR